MNPVLLWTVYAEPPVPTVRPHNHGAGLHQALTARPGVISLETLILGMAGKHYVSAGIVLAARDDSLPVARLPTGPLRTIKVSWCPRAPLPEASPA
jgi:hypothetical protein